MIEKESPELCFIHRWFQADEPNKGSALNRNQCLLQVLTMVFLEVGHPNSKYMHSENLKDCCGVIGMPKAC